MKSKFIVFYLGIVALSQYSFAQNPLYIPPVLNGPNYDLTMQNGTTTFIDGHPSATMGFNGNVLGPTLMMQAGQDITINVLNSIGEESTVHWHGLHVSAENDGGPHSVIAANQTFSPAFTVLNKAATYWYHPHLHTNTDKQVSKGLQGMIIVKDAEEAALNLPRTYGIDDFPLIVQTKSIDPATGNIRYVSLDYSNSDGNKDDVKMVNATMNPYLNVPRQLVRFRLLNASDHRVFEFGLSTAGVYFNQIASDGGLLVAPYTINRLRLAPGERAEILIDFSIYAVGTNVQLMSFAAELPNGLWGATMSFPGGNSPGYSPNPLNGTNFSLLEFRVTAATANPITSYPSTLATVTRIPAGNATVNRYKFFSEGTSTNGSVLGDYTPQNTSPPYSSPYQENFVNERIKLNTTEIWELQSYDGQFHPFHLHDVGFFILDRKKGNNAAVPPMPGEQGLKDVVLINPGEVVRIITKFTDFTSDVPFVYHCHILPHEDTGMMHQFTVSDDIYVNTGYTGATQDGSVIYPYKTVRAALNAAQDGSTLIFVSSGDHVETPPDLLISKNIKMKLLNGAITVK